MFSHLKITAKSRVFLHVVFYLLSYIVCKSTTLQLFVSSFVSTSFLSRIFKNRFRKNNFKFIRDRFDVKNKQSKKEGAINRMVYTSYYFFIR